LYLFTAVFLWLKNKTFLVIPYDSEVKSSAKKFLGVFFKKSTETFLGFTRVTGVKVDFFKKSTTVEQTENKKK
jgi:hypothetical protein